MCLICKIIIISMSQTMLLLVQCGLMLTVKTLSIFIKTF